MFFGHLKKTQIVCRGAKIIFWQFVRVSKKGIRKKNVHFLFLSFFVGERKRENMKKMEKIKKAQKNSVLGVCEENWSFFVKMSFFRKIGKHYLCSEGKRKKVRIFVATICFWKMVLFLVPIQSHQTLQK